MKPNIFLTVTAGRTGTGYLQQLCSIIPNFTSVHESEIPSSMFWDNTLRYIQDNNITNYVETSHLICKGWIEPLMGFNIIPNLIILQRDPREIATSLFELNTIPARTKKGIKYLMQPGINTFTQIDEAVLTDYELCYWYCLEIEKRQEYYHRFITDNGGKAFFTSISQLTQLDHYKTLLNFFNVVPTDDIITRYNNTVHKKVNKKINKKKNKLLLNAQQLNTSEEKVKQLIQSIQ